MAIPIIRFSSHVDGTGKVWITGETMDIHHSSINVMLESVDTGSHIAVTSDNTEYYLMVDNDADHSEFSRVVSWVLRGMVKKHRSPYQSPYHNRGKVNLNRDEWYEITKYLSFDDRRSLRCTSKYHHLYTPVFTDKHEFTDTIQSLINPSHVYMCSPVPIPALYLCIDETHALSLMDTIVNDALDPCPEFYCILMVITGRILNVNYLSTIPSQLMSSRGFIRCYLRHSPSVVKVLTYVINTNTSGWLWVDEIVKSPSWNWYDGRYLGIVSRLATSDGTCMLYPLMPTGLPQLLVIYMDILIRLKSHRTISVIVSSEKLTDYYNVNPELTVRQLIRLIKWLTSHYNMNIDIISRLVTRWDPILTPIHKHKIYQCMADMSKTRPWTRPCIGVVEVWSLC